MNDIQNEFLNVISGLRAHLEYQRALGVTAIETTPVAAIKGAAGKAAEEHDNKTAPHVSGKPEGLDAVRREIGDCARCKLQSGRTNMVFGEGAPKAALMFIGEGPGSDEDRQGRPFVGEAGRLLTRIIENAMKLRREDVYICNVVKCRPPNNRAPEPDEIEACRRFMIMQIEAVRPKVIVALGNVAAKALLDIRDPKAGITALRGRWSEFKGIPVMPTFHPSYLLRNESAKKPVWEDIQKVMEKLGE